MEELTRSQRKKKRTLERIIKASYDVFSNRGLSQATLEEIAEAADIGKGTLYGHFESKMHLIAYLVRHSIDELIGFIKDQVGKPGNLSDLLSTVISRQVEFFLQNIGMFKLLFYARALVKQESKEPQVKEIRKELNRYLDFLSENLNGNLPGNRAKIPPADLAVALAGTVDGSLSYWLIEGLKAEDIGKKATLLTTIILKGLSGEAAA